jgi:7-carboxy-7-deazaguanine synthase
MSVEQDQGELLPLMEEFYTIQGEGYHTGKPAYFVRIGGCDVGCYWCDVKESWNAKLHPLTPADNIIEHARECPAKAIVVTGGEPLIYQMDYFTKGLHAAGLQTFLETSGSHQLTGEWDWICLSPKKKSPPKVEIYPMANELKVIVFDESDFEWAEQNAALVNERCHLSLQPEWSRMDKVMPLIVDYVLLNPRWNISLQSHKFMHIP